MNSSPTDRLVQAFEDRDRQSLVREITRLLLEQPTLGRGGWAKLRQMADLVGEGSLSIRAADLSVKANPGDPMPVLELGGTLLRYGKVEMAAEVARRLLDFRPDLAAAHYMVGYCRAQLGQNAEAEDALRAAIRLRPEAGDAWVILATVKKFSKPDPDLEKLRGLCAAARDDDPEMRGSLHLALGMALDQIGDINGAFDAFSVGASVYAAAEPYSAELETDFTNELVAGFDKGAIAFPSPSQVTSDRPIFVVGLPRSGTTLMEQILTSHSKVAAGGEINLLVPAFFGLEEFTPKGLRQYFDRTKNAGLWSSFGKAYLHLLDDRFGKSEAHVVDKSLSTFRYLGFALASVPKAKVLWMRRDPRDVAWSAFRTRFGGGEAWSWSLREMPAHFAAERALHTHWQRIFPDSVLSVPYEELVRKPEQWIPRALAHCGLADEAATRKFNENPRAVGTASLAQVRQPLYSSSIGSWRKYERHLAPHFRNFDAFQ